MRLNAKMIVASAAFMASSMASLGEVPCFEIGKELTLRAGESAQARDGGFRVGFDGVTADSRCPKGEQCVWAGDATARVWLQQSGGAKVLGELHTSAGAAQTANLLGYEVKLLRLDPNPISGRSIAKADYIATLSLSRSSTDMPDR